EESQNECAEAKHIKIQDFSCLTTFHCNSIFALLLSFPKSLNFLLSPLEFAGEPVKRTAIGHAMHRAVVPRGSLKSALCQKEAMQKRSTTSKLKCENGKLEYESESVVTFATSILCFICFAASRIQANVCN
ncbi:MAG: hypothetical protein IKJ71_04535, partial [Bacteroidaceae bacterium]|nr:hypothetical protein [Bacteroidaceae bacterium]